VMARAGGAASVGGVVPGRALTGVFGAPGGGCTTMGRSGAGGGWPGGSPITGGGFPAHPGYGGRGLGGGAGGALGDQDVRNGPSEGCVSSDINQAQTGVALGRGSLSNLGNVIGMAGRPWRFEGYVVRHRWLKPGIGRWARRDPLGCIDGSNLYQYAESSPVVGTDPFGTTYRNPSGCRDGLNDCDLECCEFVWSNSPVVNGRAFGAIACCQEGNVIRPCVCNYVWLGKWDLALSEGSPNLWWIASDCTQAHECARMAKGPTCPGGHGVLAADQGIEAQCAAYLANANCLMAHYIDGTCWVGATQGEAEGCDKMLLQFMRVYLDYLTRLGC
jgi:RHS repeat-associated protein